MTIKVFSWLNELLENQTDFDSATTSLILNLILQLDEKSVEYGDTLQEISIEFTTELGTIDRVS